MTPQERQLHDLLAEQAPSSVDTTGWAAAARRRANQTRLRATVAVALGVVLIVGVSTTGLLFRDMHRAPLPAHPSAPSRAETYAALCSADQTEVGSFPEDGPPSIRYSVIALCPENPSDSAWAQLPRPALLGGTHMDLLASGGGPPVENCEQGRPTLPGYSVMARDLHGTMVATPGVAQRCGGAQFAQSFAAALAEQQYDSAHPDAGGCTGIRQLDTIPPPRRLSGTVTVDLCVTADPYVEAEPSPLRYRPLLVRHLSQPQWRPVVEAVAGATLGAGKYTDCPWRHTTIYVVATDGTGARKAALIRCQQDYSGGDVNSAQKLATMRGTWPTLPGPAQQLLEQQVTAYLAGRPGR